MTTAPLISFCTGCMGRLHHLEQVFLDNLIFNVQTYPNVEFILLDYNSQDGLEEWVRENLTEFIQAGIVIYLQERSRTHWNMSHAKNVAHLAAAGEIICNVDADNRILPDFACHLAMLFATSNPIVTAPLPDDYAWETSGRIAIRRSDFRRLGGYSEAFVGGYGLEDHELIVRATRIGLSQKNWDAKYDDVIHHDNSERGRHLPVSWRASCFQSEQVHAQTLGGKNTVANPELEWGHAEVIRNFDATIIISPDHNPVPEKRPAVQFGPRLTIIAEERRGSLAEAHLEGESKGVTCGWVSFWAKLGRARNGAVKVASLCFETDDSQLVIPAGLLARLACGRPVSRVRDVGPRLFNGPLLRVDQQRVETIVAAWHAMFKGLE